MALFTKGNKYGRPKGSKNKINNDVRQIFHRVYNDMGIEYQDPKTGILKREDGHQAMLRWAKENPTEFYRLYGKMIPTTQEVNIDTHEDFLDELILEADGGVVPKAVDVSDVEPLDTKRLTTHLGGEVVSEIGDDVA